MIQWTLITNQVLRFVLWDRIPVHWTHLTLSVLVLWDRIPVPWTHLTLSVLVLWDRIPDPWTHLTLTECPCAVGQDPRPLNTLNTECPCRLVLWDWIPDPWTHLTLPNPWYSPMPDMAAGEDAVGLRVKMWGCPLPPTCDQDLEKTGLHPGKDYIDNLVFIYNLWSRQAGFRFRQHD